MRTFRPARSAIRPTRVVTVLFPFVPVIPTTGASTARANISMSPTISSPRARASKKKGSASEIPGEATTYAAFSSKRTSSPPTLTGISGNSSRRRASSGGSVRVSVIARRQPSECR